MALVSGKEANAFGVPYYLFYAFGLDLDAGRLPISMEKQGERLVLLVDLPQVGLAEDLTVEVSGSMSGADWSDLDGSYCLSGTDSLRKGASGVARIELPKDERVFVRLAGRPGG